MLAAGVGVVWVLAAGRGDGVCKRQGGAVRCRGREKQRGGLYWGVRGDSVGDRRKDKIASRVRVY